MKQIIHFKKLLSVGILCAICFSLQAQTVYVKPGGTGNGQSWANALGDIQQALNTPDIYNVYVAEGIYQLSAPLVVGSDIELCGGFAGTEEHENDREFSDLDGNGIIEPWELTHTTVLYATGNHRVVEARDEGFISGFTISNGKAENGGGVYLEGWSIIAECIIENNTATGNGGGVYLNGSGMGLCLVRNNTYSGNGGGAYATANSIIESCKIENNNVHTGDIKVGDIVDGGVVYKVDYTARQAAVVSIEKSPEIAWNNAAAWCTSYNGNGYYFPTDAELQQVYIVKDILNLSLENKAGAAFGNEPYWAASESGSKASLVIFDTGYAGTLEKTANLSVRAVKSITF
jgi:parallel beta-helix repeat (two copies)